MGKKIFSTWRPELQTLIQIMVCKVSKCYIFLTLPFSYSCVFFRFDGNFIVGTCCCLRIHIIITQYKISQEKHGITTTYSFLSCLLTSINELKKKQRRNDNKRKLFSYPLRYIVARITVFWARFYHINDGYMDIAYMWIGIFISFE